MNIIEAINYCSEDTKNLVSHPKIIGEMSIKDGGFLTNRYNSNVYISNDKIDGWEIVNKTYTWQEAFEMLKNGKSMRKIGDNGYYKSNSNQILYFYEAHDKKLYNQVVLDDSIMSDTWEEALDD